MDVDIKVVCQLQRIAGTVNAKKMNSSIHLPEKGKTFTLKNRIPSDRVKSTSARATRGFLWLSAGGGFENGLRFVRNMILTRIIAPEAFGLMAIVFAINAAFQSFTEIGIKQAIIQHEKGNEQTFLNGAWWLSCARGFSLYIVAFLGAPFVADFYNNPALIPLLRVAFLGLVCSSLTSPQAYVALKKLDFKRWVVIFYAGGAVGIVTTVVLAFVLLNVWALVLGFVTETCARFVLSHLLCPFRPGFQFEQGSLQALLKYARRMLGLPILTFIFIKIDIFVLGKFSSATDLGLYSMAVALAQIPIQVSTTIAEVLMPTFSEMQHELERVNHALLKVTEFIVLFGSPILLFIILCGKEILGFVYGDTYQAVAVPLALIFTTAFLRVSILPIVAVYLAVGRPDLHRLFAGIRAGLVILIIVPCVQWFGLIGAAGAILTAMIIGYILQLLQIRSLTLLSLTRYNKIFWQAGINMMAGALCWYLVHRLFHGPSINFIAGCVGIVVASGCAIWMYIKSNGAVTAANAAFAKYSP